MSQFDTATEELATLVRDYFGLGWKVRVTHGGQGWPTDEVYITLANGKKLEEKHLVRALELLPEALDENDADDWREKIDSAHREGYDEAEKEFESERITFEYEIEDLKLQIKHLEDELREERCRIHTSNADEE